MTIEHEEIKTILRQRFPLLLVDRVTEISEMEATGVKNITGSDIALQGHFPDEPLFPGVFLIEAMSQLGGVLLARGRASGSRGYLVKVDKVKFMKFVRPGDQVRLCAKKMQSAGNFFRCEVSAYVGKEKVGEGEITYLLKAA